MFLTDRITIDSKRTHTPEGYLIVPAKIGRTGIQEYLAAEIGLTDRDPMERVRVYRPAEEVFKPDSLASFANKPVTDNHPPEMVNASNFKQYAVGFSANDIQQNGMFMETVLTITDADTIKKIEGGKVELSNGYNADFDFAPGITSDGENYEVVQRNIYGNHIAVVEKGRAGSSCKVADKSSTKEETMRLVIDGIEFEVTDQVAQAVGKVQRKLADAEKELAEKDEELEKKKKEMDEMEEEKKKTEDAAKAKVDDALSKVPTTETIDQMVTDRIAFIETVKTIDADFDWKGKDQKTIMTEIVMANCKNVSDTAEEGYIKARFDILAEDAASDPSKALNNAFTKAAEHKVDDEKVEDTRSPSQIARDKAIEENRNAWKRK